MSRWFHDCRRSDAALTVTLLAAGAMFADAAFAVDNKPPPKKEEPPRETFGGPGPPCAPQQTGGGFYQCRDKNGTTWYCTIKEGKWNCSTTFPP
jgi:hypothetical protein